MTVEKPETLSGLLRRHMRVDAADSYRSFVARAVDPETGFRPSTHTVGRILKGELVKVNPALIGALAAGLRLPESQVRAAAALEYLGLDVSDVSRQSARGADVSAVHESGTDPEGPLNRAQIRRIEDEEFGGRGQTGKLGVHKT